MFNYLKTNAKKLRNKSLASKLEIEKLNKYKNKISETAKFYDSNLSDQVIDYIYKGKQELNLDINSKISEKKLCPFNWNRL